MEILFNFTSVLQAIAISLGVGCSTLAIVNFFVAIADGRIDENERRMMGVVYVILRIAMVLILITTFTLSVITINAAEGPYFTPFVGALWTLIAVLYVNAILMTLHVVPSTIGPALQAATWYTLGIVTALVPLALADFSYLQFFLSYAAVIILAVAVVNGLIAFLKERKKRTATNDSAPDSSVTGS